MVLRKLHPMPLVALLLFVGYAFAEGNSTAAPAKPGIALDKLKRVSQKKAAKNLFAAKSWAGSPRQHPQNRDVPVEVPQAAAPAAEVAPPIPFSYVGRMLDAESGKLVLYLAKNAIPYLVSVGDVIDGKYRVEGVTEEELTLIYLPLNTKQTLTIGDRNS